MDGKAVWHTRPLLRGLFAAWTAFRKAKERRRRSGARKVCKWRFEWLLTPEVSVVFFFPRGRWPLTQYTEHRRVAFFVNPGLGNLPDRIHSEVGHVSA